MVRAETPLRVLPLIAEKWFRILGRALTPSFGLAKLDVENKPLFGVTAGEVRVFESDSVSAKEGDERRIAVIINDFILLTPWPL